MLQLIFFDFLISVVSTVILYFFFNILDLNVDNIYIVLGIVFSIFFTFSVFFSFYIQKIKQKIIFLNTQIEKLKKFDEVTDVYNRDFLLENLKKYFDISKRKDIPLSIMIVEVEDYKKINEINGLEKSNLILKQVSDILKNNIRGMDIIGRYNINEFLIVSFAKKEEFLQLANRIHNILTKELNISINIGVSERNKFDKLEDILKKAQEAVFLAHKKGGNRIDVLEHFLLIE